MNKEDMSKSLVKTDHRTKETIIRSISGFILSVLFLVITIAGDAIFNCFILLIFMGASYELQSIKEKITNNYSFLIRIWQIVLVLGGCAIIKLRSLGHGSTMTIQFASLIIACDSGAYFIGRKFGGIKIAPKISPNKTLSGALGGIVMVWIVGKISTILSTVSIDLSTLELIILAIITQVGDLSESFLKRKCKVKNSGSIIPGHGGILDRIDGAIFAAPFFLFIAMN